jgi:hypothetical protein
MEKAEMKEENVRQLVAAILLQATKDYVRIKQPARRAQILKDLRSKHMIALAGDQSLLVAEQLEKHEDEIAKRLQQNHECVL